jgi:hypothetical protein
MPTPTLQEQLDAAYAARLKILSSGEELGLDGGNLRRANLDTINKTITSLENQIARQARPRGSLTPALADFGGGA